MALFCAVFSFAAPSTSFAAGNGKAGEYFVDAKLSCYVNAMGGVEFGEPLLTGAMLVVDKNGKESLKLTFTKSQVTIYNVTCDTFIDAEPSYVTEDRGVKSGTIGIYKSNGKLETKSVSYTLSDDTAENPKKEQVHYVDSITAPIDKRSDSYNFTFYINSNTMGVQFCNENSKATSATYPATLSVDWDSLSKTQVNDTTENSSTPSTASETTATQAAAEADNNTGSENTAAVESESSTQGTEKSVSENVVEDEGLNIHYAQSANDESKATDRITAYYNMPVIIGILIFGAVMIIVGVIFIIVAKKPDKKPAEGERGNESN